MKILVTGANGFIAKNLIEQLSDQHSLIGLNHQALDLLKAEQVLEYLKQQRFDAVIHTATYDAAPKYSTKDPNKVLENNLRMFFSLVRGQDYFGKLIYFGSGAEFSREHWIPKMSEDYFDLHVPSDQYGLSKYIMTKYAQLSRNIYNLRLFTVFGKYSYWRTRFLSNACCHAVLGLPIRIDQNRFVDYLYIDDLVKIVHWFIVNKPAKQVYNVCSGQSLDSMAVAKKLVKITGEKLKIHVKTEELGKEYSADNCRLMAELPGINFKPFDVALKELYDWYASNKGQINKEEL
jgi:GDP-L-fucose synthase